MKYTELINKSIDFIENNLKNDIKVEKIAESIGYSLYHFNRMFAFNVGETPGSYLRKRRLTESAKDIKNNSKKIIDISLDYCFGSQEAFTRSFKSLFEINPLEYRNSDISLKTFEKIYLKEKKFSEEIIMQHRIDKKEKMILVGVNSHVTGHDFDFMQAWADFMQKSELIKNKKNYAPIGLGVYPESFPEPWQFMYMPSFVVTEISEMPLEFSYKIIPESDYIVFTHAGPAEKINETYDEIYSKKLAELGCKSDSNYDFEYYDQRFDKQNPEKSEMEIWVPIKL